MTSAGDIRTQLMAAMERFPFGPLAQSATDFDQARAIVAQTASGSSSAELATAQSQIAAASDHVQQAAQLCHAAQASLQDFLSRV
ncbi:hypothetical protein [Saccharopolyspora sp. 6V]|uniref:hypothetical protein n=1 Tax=Saccharopolyspora sp. 6V TaxID=2877239 RepID=UPI001CD79174|nr:hypothetical protein [Saccharopolyspora sp. 6V]MCA1195148.1 hypothetical protein [Saccharopolyspora sp. 6V]